MKVLSKSVIALFIVGLLAFTTACGSSGNDEEGNSEGEKETLSISGSTSVGPLTEKLAQSYSEVNKNIKIEVNQIGSSAGITNAINGVSEIGMSSRDLKEEEKAQVKETIIAYDGIVVVSHPSNKVDDLTLDQVKQIFTGEITNWSEVGGENMEIVVVSREDGSGSRDAFQEIVGYRSGELVKEAIIASGNGNIKTTVAMNKHAIGFISFEYIDETISTMKINGVASTAENVLNQSYSLSRPFLFVHKEDELTETGKLFINYILSEDGQVIVSEVGAIPVN